MEVEQEPREHLSLIPKPEIDDPPWPARENVHDYVVHLEAYEKDGPEAEALAVGREDDDVVLCREEQGVRVCREAGRGLCLDRRFGVEV